MLFGYMDPFAGLSRRGLQEKSVSWLLKLRAFRNSGLGLKGFCS